MTFYDKKGRAYIHTGCELPMLTRLECSRTGDVILINSFLFHSNFSR